MEEKKSENPKKRKFTLIQPRKKGGKLIARKIERNAPCPCGSGKKAKHCCGCETKYYER